MSVRPAHAEDAAALAAVHASSFGEPWSAEALAGLLASTGVFALAAQSDSSPVGFILARAVADEAEILTLAVLPEHRRRGLSRALVQAALAQAAVLGARTVFLEVAEDNEAALALYAQAGFARAGRRAAYYARNQGPAADALILRKGL